LSVFADNFERANGAPGNGWSDLSGTTSITNGALTCTTAGAVVNSNTYDENRHDVTVHVSGAGAAGVRSGPVVRTLAGGTLGFNLSIRGTSRPYTLSLRSSALVTGSEVTNVSLDILIPPMYALRLVWDGGHVEGYYNGELLIETDVASGFGERYAGVTMNGSSAPVQDFSCVAGAAVELAVSPTVIGNYGDCSELTLTGTNTDWTPGTPGSPVFTVNHGSISAQEVTSSTSATITYCPGNFLGSAIFTDPSTGATAAAVVTSDPTVQPPTTGAGSLPQGVIDWLTMNAENNGNLVYSEQEVAATHETLSITGFFEKTLDTAYVTAGATPGATSTLNQLVLLWRLINGLYPVPTLPESAPNDLPLAHNIDFLHEKLNALTGNGVDTLDSILNLLGGDPFASHHTLLEAINGIATGNNQDVLDAITAMKGDPLMTLKVIFDMVYLLDPTGTHNLGQILTAITDARGTDQPTIADVLAKLYKIQPGNVPDLVDIDTHIVQQTTIQAMMDLLSLNIRGVQGHTILDVMTAIDGIELPAAIIPPQPPILDPTRWTMTMQEEFAFDAPLVHTGDCHGIYYTCDPLSKGVKGYAVEDRYVIMGAGAVGFLNHDGYPETFQYLQYDHGYLVCRTMAKATGFILSSNIRLNGTIQPFTLAPIG